MDKWFSNQEIVFESLTLYFQEKNRIFEKTNKTIMEMVQATILERGIENIL